MPSGLYSNILNDFSGGLNTKDYPPSLPGNQSPNLSNVVLLATGGVSQRPGTSLFSDIPTANQHAEHMRAWYPAGGAYLITSINGKIYSYIDSGLATLQFTGTAGTVWHFEDMIDGSGNQALWCVNGVDPPKKISTTFTVTNWTAMVDPDADYFIIRVWRNRMIAVKKNTNRVYISAIGNPESFGANDFIDVKSSEDDSDFITWAEVLGDNLIIFKKRSTWSMYAEPPAPAIKQLGGPGCSGRFQSCVAEGRCYFWSSNGLWSTDGEAAPVLETKNLNRNNFNDEDEVQDQVRVFPSRDRRIYVAAPAEGSITNNVLLEGALDVVTQAADGTQQMAWVRHDLAVISGCTFRPIGVVADSKDYLMMGMLNDDDIRYLGGLSDKGVAVRSYWDSSWQAVSDESETYERLRRVNVVMEGQVTLSILTDFLPTIKFSELLTAPTAVDPLWDGGVWDGDFWDNARNAALMRTRPDTRARYHAIRLENFELNKDFIVYSIELMIRGGKEH